MLRTAASRTLMRPALLPAAARASLAASAHSGDFAFDSKAVQPGRPAAVDAAQPLVTPIYASSTFLMDSPEHGQALSERSTDGFLYSRWDNPTVAAAAAAIAALETADLPAERAAQARTLLMGSGMAAISAALLSTLTAGDHVVAIGCLYGGSTFMLQKLLPEKMQLRVSWVADAAEAAQALTADSRLVYAETPANPVMKLTDVAALGALRRPAGGDASRPLLRFVDATFASPVLQRPLAYGVDAVIHSCTKYLAGHSDVTAGAVTLATQQLAEEVWDTAHLLGATLSPYDAFLLSRGIQTLPLRVRAQSRAALQIASALQEHPKVTAVHYPGLRSHPQHTLAKAQLQDGLFGGMLAFEVAGGVDAGRQLLTQLRLFRLAVSLGGVESLICHPASTTHAATIVPPETRRQPPISIPDGLLRVSVGVEDADDLQHDLISALDAL
eukprot:PLAT11067.1.p2 GENE.PLAT11067.1~~PLAT11067.1.p2  ORF type:complete len:443 (+),score=265.05 PLAT11067.1:273-1601(+)